ncbi:MAG TPA: hypothetical protein VF104_09520 [Burkholderiales bacterium]
MMKTRLAVSALAFWCALAAGQGTIYESQDQAGPVFSDQPSPGAREMNLPPQNVIESPRPRPAEPTAPAPASQTPYYSAVAVSAPANGETIHTNTGAFEIDVQASPDLREGDRLQVKLDGTLLPETYRSTRIQVTEADWQGAATSDVQHTLQIAITDGQGEVMIESAVTGFYAHRATVKRELR